MLESLFQKIAGLKYAALSQQRLRHRYFSVNIMKFLRTRFFTEKPHCFCTSMQIVFSRSSNQHKEMLFHLLRSSQRKYSLKKGVLENFAISTGKYLCCSHFLVMLQTFRPATLIRRDSNIGIFLWVLRNFCGYFKNTHFEKFLQTASSVFNLLSH